MEWVPENMQQCAVNEHELKEHMRSLGYVEVSTRHEEKLFKAL